MSDPREYAVDPMMLADMMGMDRVKAGMLLESSDHNYDCRCEKCLRWWVYMGPENEDDEELSFGPFSQEEVERAAEEMEHEIWWR